MLFYYILIGIALIILIFSFYNIYKSSKIEKSIENYVYIATTSKSYFIGSIIFSLALFIVVSIQAMPYNFDIRILSIEIFFLSIFMLSLSHLIYYLAAKRKLKDYKEFFQKLGADINNKCHLLMIKHILHKEKNIEKVKNIFLKNIHLCKEKEKN